MWPTHTKNSDGLLLFIIVIRSKKCYSNSTLVWSRCLFTRAIWRCIFFQSRAVNTSPIHTHQPKRGFMLWFRAPEGNRPFLKPLLQKDCRKQKQTCLLTCFENDFLSFSLLPLCCFFHLCCVFENYWHAPLYNFKIEFQSM